MPSWKRLRLAWRANARIPGNEPGEIGGEEARPTESAGCSVDEQGERQHEDRQQAVIEVEPADEARDRQAAGKAKDCAEAHVDEEAGDDVHDQDLGLRIEAGGNYLDQRDGEEDGDRIVGAGLDFESGSHAVAKLQIASAQQEEDGGGIGGRYGRAEQEGFKPAEIREVEGGDADQAGGDDDADGRER